MTAKHRHTARHAAPSDAGPGFWTALLLGIAALAIATGTLASSPVVDGIPHAAPGAPDWLAEGYDGTDADLAQFAYDHGQMIEGYGVDVTKVYDLSKPYGWKAERTAYIGYCGDAALAEGEYVDDVAMLDAGKRCAAELIILRIMGGGSMAEDWTWRDAPPAVNEFNDALITDYQAAGRPVGFLAGVARVG